MHYKAPTRAAHLLIMGDKQVGKSASIVKFTTGRFIHNYSRTNRDWLYKRHLEHCSISVELLELEDAQPLPGSSQPATRVRKYEWAHAFVIIYSITSRSSFARAREYLRSVLEFCEQAGRNSNIPAILILGNKNDLSIPERQVPYEEGRRMADLSNCLFDEISTLKSAMAIESMLTKLVDCLDESSLDQSRPWLCQECGVEKSVVRWPLEDNFEHTQPVKSSTVRTRLPTMMNLHPETRAQFPRINPPVSKSVVAATVAFCRPLLSMSPKVATPRPANQIAMSHLAQIQTVNPPNSMVATALTGGRSLRSSFKKASLAIVGGKTPAFKKSQVKQGEKSVNTRKTSADKRPLMKYKRRLQTLAFEPNFTREGFAGDGASEKPEEQYRDSASLQLKRSKISPVISESNSSEDLKEGPDVKTTGLPRPLSSDSSGNQCYSSPASRPESGCVLSRTFDGAAPTMTSGPRSVLNKLNNRRDSRSTLSRASTSGGSYGDDEDEDEIGSLGGDRSEGSPMWPSHQQPVIEMVCAQSRGCTVSEAPRISTIAFCKALIKAARGIQSKAK